MSVCVSVRVYVCPGLGCVCMFSRMPLLIGRRKRAAISQKEKEKNYERKKFGKKMILTHFRSVERETGVRETCRKHCRR